MLDQPTRFELTRAEKSVATVHLDTLAGFRENRPGKYYMSALKRIAGTEAFMALSNGEKGCQPESFEECNMRQVFAELQRECKCVPWSLRDFQKVGNVHGHEREKPHFSQGVPFCSPAEESCVASAMQANHGCLVKCTGLYADVRYSEEDNKIPDMINDGDAKLLALLKVGGLSFFCKEFK